MSTHDPFPKSEPTAAITIDDLNRAMRDIEAAYDQELAAAGERARIVDAWLERLPPHARRHLFVQQAASAQIGGVVMHPRDADRVREHIDKIAAMTPEEAAADSKQMLADLRENYDIFGMPR